MFGLIAMGVSAAASAISSSNTAAAGAASESWAHYNNQLNYEASKVSLQSEAVINQMNQASLAVSTNLENRAILADLSMNTAIVSATTLYNDELYEDELMNLWDSTGLDLKLLDMQRAKERGTIEGQQAASGTVMGTGSNAEVIIDLETQAALDTFVVEHNADVAANQIINARNKNLYEGELALKKMVYEGERTIKTNTANASITLASMATESNLSQISGSTSALTQLQTGTAVAAANRNATNTQANNSLVSGLFGAAAKGVESGVFGEDISIL